MAVITGYSSLNTAIADWLARSNLTTFIPNFVQNWEQKFYRQPRNFGYWMETDFTSVITAGVIALPTGYLNLKYAYIDGNPSTRLDRVSQNQLLGTYPRGLSTGRPRWIARDAQNFIFGPEPDDGYTVVGTYWQTPTPLRSDVSDAAASWIILNAPDLPLYGALLEAEAFLKNDARLQIWQGFYDRAVENYRDLFWMENISGSPIQEVLA